MPEDQETKKPNSNETNKPPDIGNLIDLFVNQIDALAETLPLAALAIQEARIRSAQELTSFLKDEFPAVRSENGKTTYTFDQGQHLKFHRLLRRVEKANLANSVVPRGLLVALVSQFDALVGALIRHLLKSKPEILNSSERHLTFSELAAFASIEDATDHILDKEVESVLRESHSDQFGWLERKFNVPLRKDLAVWPVFVEVAERRNLFVHTNGVVSQQYLDVCRRHGCKMSEDARKGKQLPLGRDYFQTAYECILEIGVKLGQVLWRKVLPMEISAADKNLINATYNLLVEGRYQSARILLDFATQTLKKHSTESDRLTLVINRAQAHKWGGDEDTCRQILNAEDWTATGAKYQLAHAVLSDDFGKANLLVRQIGANDDMLGKNVYREWPLFKEYRKTAEFNILFEELFGEPMNKFVVERGQEAQLS